MASEFPPELAFLNADVNGEGREHGWSRFVESYTRLLLRTAGEFGADYDGRMDRYRFVLDALREEECRRLRAFRPVAGSSVAAWLVVVARRLCLDYERRKQGRVRNENPTDEILAQRRLRRSLTLPGGGDFDPTDRLPTSSLSPEEELREADLKRAVDNGIIELHRFREHGVA